ncbi:50S ribosomal protein L14 [Patescibacteria group bacterium]|nr:50S ribosomal protein L14 [Patescibacteria group bacterium]MBU4274930.1 50S ribosomal protein L14 [Patescibacteria group bacterium]MBU4367888.1 50S ribosomal protein L14 [Patescibacteria group bacterium]MBU4461935.1 50S ribosomal protein L14 [Patescibacteria group bacterium]MCG2699878.1 50S ribosomal protein L14 [Candidatus Parcubacteria bacterium]
MIQPRTIIKIADNTGAKIVQCITVLGGTRHRFAQLGDIIVGAVKKAEPRKLIKKHEIVRALIIRQRREYKRPDGSYVRFDDNAAVVIDADNKPRGGRVFGPMAKEIKEKGFNEVAALAPELV